MGGGAATPHRGGSSPAPEPPRRSPSLRQALGALLAVVLVLAVLLFGVTVVQLSTATDRSDAERGRVTSFRLADQVRQSSNDLTRMVRLAVTTGDPVYRTYYDRILQIRRGTAPRPVDYDSSFWDRVLADGYGGVRTGPAVSLPELMRRARFSPTDFEALDEALRVSDRLAVVEVRSMDAAERLAADGTGDGYLRRVGPEYRRLVDGAYHAEKRRIMAAIERFSALVDRRTSRRVDVLQRRTDRLLVAQSVFLGALGLVLALLLTVATRSVVRPLERLAAVTRRIRGGDWSARAPEGGVRELRQLAGDFDEMTAAVQRELHGRQRVEREAIEARRRLQTIADRVPGSVFHFHVDRDAALSVRFASRDASVHGIAGDDGVDFPAVSRAVLAEDRGAWLDSLLRARTRDGTWEHEYRIRAPDGRTAWMHGHALVRTSGDGSADLYGYVADISEQKALEADLLRAREAAEGADRAKSAFLAMMSHELRTPLVAVTGTLEVLALGELETRQRERVEVASRSAHALLAVIGDVLDFSKIESGHLELDPAPTSLPRLVRELVAQHEHTARRKGLELRAQIDDDVAPAHVVDAVRLRQVLGNLVGNALKFTTDGGVRVALRGGTVAADGTQAVELRVRDTGIGIAPEDQERLFSPFTQASTDTARRSDGTGLGLVISLQLVDAMGGTLTMESTLGEGTTMRVALGLPTAEESALLVVGPADAQDLVLRPRPTREAAIAEGSLVLLVEDHPVNRAVLAAQVEAAGAVVDVAADADEAQARFAEERYGLVFTDIQLPGTDGYALATRLRAYEAAHDLPRTPILALTASAVRGEESRCREAGMDGLVTKPTTIAVLATTLRLRLPHVDWEAGAVGPGTVGAATADRDGAGAPTGAGDRPQGLPAIDRSALDELTGGDPELGADILATYRGSLPDDLDALVAARTAADEEAARTVAHRMGSAARMVGATAVAVAAESVEAAVLDGLTEWAERIDAVARAAGELRRSG
ncbi:hybrid sensor histidine kinase/response regulator [Patulibacter minatonensis]|uniref:hybrid sensor histidine kinase/response regulator n=1 Tax=Patulibacter minatonensis TaxID=298163 RepID=UPI0004BBE4E3|nr:ATP-binding protein [Patulibacter minatonensis]